ncbi:MAG: ATP synthase F0 subunit A [Aquificota bacterium]|nr:MAG: ATP synthase F0 subunit A [Aquificota bacterium]
MYEPYAFNLLPEHYKYIFLTWVVMAIMVVLALVARKGLTLIPKGWQNFMESYVEGMLSFMSDIMGGHDARPYFPLIGTLFLFILISNWIGLVPGFIAPTSNWNTTIAPAIVVFFYYHYVGIRKQGVLKYFKHFGGPVWWLSPLIFVLETIGHFARVLSLSIRLFGNIFGEESLFVVLFSLVPLLVPVPIMFLSIFFGFIQALVFTMLSIVYIALAVEEEEH